MIRLTIPSVEEDDLQAMREVLASGYLVQGAKVAAFEKTVADYVGTKYAVAVSSGTAALHLGLLALSIQPGDLVVVHAPHPRRYRVEFSFTNHGVDNIFVKGYELTILGHGVRKQVNLDPALRLEPREVRRQIVTFPLSDDEIPVIAGTYVLEIVPSVGKAFGVQGTFPKAD